MTNESRKATCKTADDVFTLLENSTQEYRQWFYDNFTLDDLKKFFPNDQNYFKFLSLMVEYNIC